MNIGALADEGLTRLRHIFRLEDPRDETSERLFRALGSNVSSLVVSEVNEIYQLLIEEHPEVVAEGLQQLAQLVITARVDFPGNDEDEIFQNAFLQLRAFASDSRYFPYFASIFHAAVRSRDELRKKKQIDKRMKSAERQRKYFS